MKFNYYSEFEEWAREQGYDADEFLNEEVLLQKSYSKIIRFYIEKEGTVNSSTYAEVRAYHSADEGLFDIEIQAEGLKRTEEEIVVKKIRYV